MTARPDLASGTVLAVPRKLVLPEAAQDRLHRRFQRTRPAVGVVAPIRELAPGSSVTTAAERAAMTPIDAGTTTTAKEVHGAVLLAPGVAHTVGDRSVTIEWDGPAGSGLLVDPGAASFDPAATATIPEPAAEEAHPPFRWRPLVLFLAGQPDTRRAQLAARLADLLVGHEIEPRLAIHAPLEGPLLTRPVLAEPSVIATLRPDLLVALDTRAVELAEHATGARRSMVVALVDDDLDDGIELVSWTIGQAHGRLRARLGPHADAAAVAALVNRLCSGPLPEPPTDAADLDPAAPVDIGGAGRPDGGSRAVVVLDPSAGPGHQVPSVDAAGRIDPDLARRRPLLAGLADHLLAARWRLAPAPTDPDPADPADLVLAGAPGTVATPRQAIHVVEDLDDAAALLALVVDDGAPRLAIAPTEQVATPLRAAGVDTIVVPLLRTRADLAAWAAASEHRVRPATPTLAVVFDDRPGARHDPATLDAVGAAAARTREVQGDLALIVVGTTGAELDRFGDGPGLVARPALGDPDDVAGWTAAIWIGGTPHDDPGPDGPRTDEPPATLASLALGGVPTVMAAPDAGGLGALADPSLLVRRPGSGDAWAELVLPLLDEPHRAVASARARRIGSAIAGAPSASLVVARVLGWCEEPSR